MTPLRQRMIDDMQLKGLSASTQQGYLNAVRQLAEHFHRSPDQLSEEDLRQYFLYRPMRKKPPDPRRPSRFAGSGFSTSRRLSCSWARCIWCAPRG